MLSVGAYSLDAGQFPTAEGGLQAPAAIPVGTAGKARYNRHLDGTDHVSSIAPRSNAFSVRTVTYCVYQGIFHCHPFLVPRHPSHNSQRLAPGPKPNTMGVQIGVSFRSGRGAASFIDDRRGGCAQNRSLRTGHLETEARGGQGIELVRMKREQRPQDLCFTLRTFGLPVRKLPAGQLLYHSNTASMPIYTRACRGR